MEEEYGDEEAERGEEADMGSDPSRDFNPGGIDVAKDGNVHLNYGKGKGNHGHQHRDDHTAKQQFDDSIVNPDKAMAMAKDVHLVQTPGAMNDMGNYAGDDIYDPKKPSAKPGASTLEQPGLEDPDLGKKKKRRRTDEQLLSEIADSFQMDAHSEGALLLLEHLRATNEIVSDLKPDVVAKMMAERAIGVKRPSGGAEETYSGPTKGHQIHTLDELETENTDFKPIVRNEPQSIQQGFNSGGQPKGSNSLIVQSWSEEWDKDMTDGDKVAFGPFIAWCANIQFQTTQNEITYHQTQLMIGTLGSNDIQLRERMALIKQNQALLYAKFSHANRTKFIQEMRALDARYKQITTGGGSFFLIGSYGYKWAEYDRTVIRRANTTEEANKFLKERPVPPTWTPKKFSKYTAYIEQAAPLLCMWRFTSQNAGAGLLMHTGPTKRTAVLTKQIKGSKPKRDEGPVLAEQAKPSKKAKTTVTEPETGK
jgi:hypothetical protein